MYKYNALLVIFVISNYIIQNLLKCFTNHDKRIEAADRIRMICIVRQHVSVVFIGLEL